jgi:hypothetical protein
MNELLSMYVALHGEQLCAQHEDVLQQEYLMARQRNEVVLDLRYMHRLNLRYM